MAKELYLSDQMGLFLQKTNIIRDYLEDYVDGRAFWPQSIWKKHSKSGDLGYFADQTVEEVKTRSLNCVNELVTDALGLVPDCLNYLSKLQCFEVFRFCAIPQVMAIATLDKCYHNPDVFTGVVKIRKGLSCKLINETNDTKGVHSVFNIFAKSIMKKAQKAKSAGFDDPSYEQTIKICETICELTDSAASAKASVSRMNRNLLLTTAVGWYYSTPLAVASATTLFATNVTRMMGLTLKTSLKPSQMLLDNVDASTTNDDVKKTA